MGAVAYSFPFGKEPIAGITPIEDMIAATSTAAPRAASTRFQPSFASALAFPLDRDSLIAALQRPRPTVDLQGASAPAGLLGGTLSPLALPLVFSGFDRMTFDWAQPLFAGMGFVPMTGGASGGTTAPVEPPRPRPRRPGRDLPDRGRPRPLRDRHRDPHRWGPRLCLRPPLLQPRPHPVPHEEGLRLLGVSERPAVLEDRRRPRSGRHGRAGPDHGHRRTHRKEPADDPGGDRARHQPRRRAHLPLPDRRGRALHSRPRLRLPPLRAAGERARFRYGVRAGRRATGPPGRPHHPGGRSLRRAAALDAGGRARGGAPRLPDGQRFPEGHGGATRREGLLVRDQQERSPRAGLGGAHGAPARGHDHPREGRAADLSRERPRW